MNRLTVFAFLALLLFACPPMAAQDNSNPFELQWRLPKAETGGTEAEMLTYRNPFDIVEHVEPASQVNMSELSPAAERTDLFRLFGFGKEPKTFLVWITFLILGYLAFVMATVRGAILKAWNAFLNPNQFLLLFRDWTTNQLLMPYLLLYLNFLLNTGFFLYLVLRILRNQAFGGAWLFTVCVFAAALFYFFKHFAVWVSGNIYPVKEECQKYNFLMSSSNNVIGLFLVPFNLLIAFIPQVDGFLVFWGLSLFAILYFFRSFKALSFGAGIFTSDKFHFLLYLCALEIMPLLIVAKLVWDYVL